MGDYRVVNTEDLRAIFLAPNAVASQKGLRPFFESKVDPEGNHLLERVFAFHNDGDMDRCRVMIKIKDSDEPTTTMVDVKHSLFERLLTPEQVKEQFAKADG